MKPLLGILFLYAGCALAAGSLFAQGGRPAVAPSHHPNGLLIPTPPATVARDAMGRTSVRATRIDEALSIDGRLDESVYSSILPIGDFIQQEPAEGAPATERTEAWIFFDSGNIYVSARCWDSNPGEMVASELRRDSFNIFLNDNFAVTLDTFYDRRNAFLFYTNPVGGLSDGYITAERDNNRDWNTVWDARTQIFDSGWTVEIVIPFKSLRYGPGANQVWGINFRRVVRSKNEFSYLTRIPASFGGRGIQKVSSSATLVGLEVPEAGRNLEIKPFAIATMTTNREAEPPLSNKVDGDAGFDLKYGITRGLTADFTVNTDFAQVEDDEQQVNLTRFSLFFPEKREFFLEGQGIFAFGGAGGRGRGGPGWGPPSLTPVVFFSRRIGLKEGKSVPIRAGGRLTGRAGSYTIGALNIQTADEPSVDALGTNYSVFRLKRDVFNRSTVGFILTNRSPASGGTGSNQVAGLDAAFSFHENLNIDAFYARSWTPDRPGDATSYRAALDYAHDLYGLQLDHLHLGEDFNPGIGFLRRGNFRREFGQVRYSPRPRSIEWIRKVSWEASLEYIAGGDGRLESRQAQLETSIELENGDRWNFDYTRSYEFLREGFDITDDVVIPAGGYGFQNVSTSYNLGPQRWLSGNLSFEYGGFYDGTRATAGYRGRVELSHRLAVEPGISINRVRLPWGDFTLQLVSARVNLALSPRMLIGSLIQYSSGANAFVTNLRFRWEYKPGSDFFIVYSDGRDTEGVGFPRVIDRTLAFKITRLLRF